MLKIIISPAKRMNICDDHFVESHLSILSGFYGILKPSDGVIPYRLEMQTKLQAGSAGNLYDY